MKKTKTNNKNLKICLSIIGIANCLFFLLIIFLLMDAYLIDNLTLFYIGFILASLIMILSAFLSLYIDTRISSYACPDCKEKFTPTFKSIFFAPHFGNKRKLICPKCHGKNWIKEEI